MNTIFQRLAQNWKSGLTVALVSIPLSLALAIASGASPAQGIITAIWAGLIGSILGGSHYNVVGPTGALSGVLIPFTFAFGFPALSLLAVVAGLIMLLCFALKLDRYVIFIPRSVVHGFTVGVACIIALGQLDNMLGLSGIEKGEKLLPNVWNSLRHYAEIQWGVVGVFVLLVLFILLWNRKFPRYPGSIIVALLGILLTAALRKFAAPISLITLGQVYPNIDAGVFERHFFSLDWHILLSHKLWAAALATALVGILESLLSGQIAQHMTKVPFHRSREVLALSLANIGSGLMGGIPATAALARTALNIKSGANHRSSGFISSICIVVLSVFLFRFYKMLPMVVVAAILFTTALRMVEARHFIKFIDNERLSFGLSLAVALITVVEDPIVGLIFGAFVALLIFANKVSYGQTEILVWRDGRLRETMLKTELEKRETMQSELLIYNISGTLTYINMPAHLDVVAKIRDCAHVVVSLRHAFYADLDGIEYLGELIGILKQHNQRVYLAGINEEVRRLIVQEDFYQRKLVENKIFRRSSDAVAEIFGEKSLRFH